MTVDQPMRRDTLMIRGAAGTHQQLEIHSGAPERCYELTAFGADLSFLDAAWPRGAGEVRYGIGNRVELLHFAPGRWLAPNPDDALLDALNAPGMSQMCAVDVSGKWHMLQLSGEQAARVLSSQISIERKLSGRTCAAVTLFDCPCILIAESGSFEIWTHASYATCLVLALERAHRSWVDRTSGRPLP